jgi:hypothetical protein
MSSTVQRKFQAFSQQVEAAVKAAETGGIPSMSSSTSSSRPQRNRICSEKGRIYGIFSFIFTLKAC